MAYTQKMKNEAYRAYREAGSLETARKLLPFHIPYITLTRWKTRYDWDKKIETEKTLLAERDPDKSELTNITQEFGMKGSDSEVYKQVRRIESICYAAIKGDQARLEDLGLVPTNFDSAMRALKACWDTRDKILSRHFKPEKTNLNTPQKVNYIQMVMQQSKGVNGNIAEAE